jgi:hypothetical protein
MIEDLFVKLQSNCDAVVRHQRATNEQKNEMKQLCNDVSELSCKHFQKSADQMVLIGGGGFGDVYTLPTLSFFGSTKLVLKGLYKSDKCEDSKLEYNQQMIAYRSLTSLQTLQPPSTPTTTQQEKILNQNLKELQKVLSVAEPKWFCTSTLLIQKKSYSCFTVMTQLQGVPFKIFKEAQVDMSNLKIKLDDDAQIMVHMNFNSTAKGFTGRSYTDPVSQDNPLRGYFIQDIYDPLLVHLAKYYNWNWTEKQILSWMGMIYGYLCFHDLLSPRDIEICLGYDPQEKKWKLNVLDFGMTVDLNQFSKELKKNTIHEGLANTFKEETRFDQLSTLQQKQVFEQIEFDISLDIYADVSDNSDAQEGWQWMKFLFYKEE